jgi:hypothetical protein
MGLNEFHRLYKNNSIAAGNHAVYLLDNKENFHYSNDIGCGSVQIHADADRK